MTVDDGGIAAAMLGTTSGDFVAVGQAGTSLSCHVSPLIRSSEVRWYGVVTNSRSELYVRQCSTE